MGTCEESALNCAWNHHRAGSNPAPATMTILSEILILLYMTPGIWFEVKAKYMKVSESGKERMVTEVFLFDAVSFTDAETLAIKRFQEIVKGGEFAINNINKSRISEVVASDDGEFYFEAKINLVTVDEEAGKEKKINSYYLVLADNIDEAKKKLDEELNYLVIPYTVVQLKQSSICDVFPYSENN